MIRLAILLCGHLLFLALMILVLGAAFREVGEAAQGQQMLPTLCKLLAATIILGVSHTVFKRQVMKGIK